MCVCVCVCVCVLYLVLYYTFFKVKFIFLVLLVVSSHQAVIHSQVPGITECHVCCFAVISLLVSVGVE